MNTDPTEEKSPFDKEIDHILKKLESMSPEDDNYITCVNNLKILCEAQAHYNKAKAETVEEPKNQIDINTVISGAVSLLGILLILNHEKLNVITSKSLGFIPKVRT